tara:strand:- start:435 stop:1373 length:939 start_codon:yes stop_codon:yes gene_type:complete
MKILIELPTWLGDTVMTTPAIENLVNFFNDSKITIIGSFIATEALKNHPKVVNTYVLDKKYCNLYKTSKSLGKFDAFFSFRSSWRSKILKFFIKSSNKYQFSKNTYKNVHQVEKYNNFINNSLGQNFVAGSLKLYKKTSSEIDDSKQIVGINPGASYGNAKMWSPKKYAKVAERLSDKYEIIIFGGQNDKGFALEIERLLIKNNILNFQNLAGQTSIEQLINIISTLDLFITGDSGPMHLAACFQIPTVALFGPTRPDETSQWLNDNNIVIKKNLECQPCMERECPLKHNDCMRLIDSEDVLNAAEKLNKLF